VSQSHNVLLRGQKKAPNGAPSLPFYRIREGPRVHERERGKEERKTKRKGVVGV
jgi:hypothetical protein